MPRSVALFAVALLAAQEVGAWQVVGAPGRTTSSARRSLAPRCQEGADPPKQLPNCDFPGCDGNGRAIGGLAAIELFSWWPIKVRHAPYFSHSRLNPLLL